MTQQDLAVAAGVDVKTIGNLESRGRWPIARTRAKIEEALGWAPGWLDGIASPEKYIPDAEKTAIAEAEAEAAALFPDDPVLRAIWEQYHKTREQRTREIVRLRGPEADTGTIGTDQ